MTYNFNLLEEIAEKLKAQGRYRDALRIYYFMADGDPSLDGGYLAKTIAECYAAVGEPYAAKYWYGRAIEENPVVNDLCADAIRSLGKIDIDDLLTLAPGESGDDRK